MKKNLAIAIAVLMIFALFAGCSNGQAPASQAPASQAASPAASQVTEEDINNLSGTVYYWSCFTGDSQVWDKNRVANYMKAYPNIKVDVQFVPDGAGIKNGKLLSAIAGGTAPDVIVSDDYSSAYSYAANGSFDPWDPYIDVIGIQLDQFLPGFQSLMKYNGKTYLLPQDSNVLLLYYNPDMYKEAGLDPNDPPETIDDLDQYADKLTVKNADGSYSRFGFIPWVDNGGDAFVLPYMFGANIYDPSTNKLTLTEQPMVDVYKWMNTYAQKYNPEKIKSFVSGFGGMFSPDHPYMTKKVAMTVTGNWFSNALRIYAPTVPYKVAPIPTPQGGRKNSSPLNSNVFAMPRGAKNPKLAAHFFRYCIQPEVNAQNYDEWRSIPCIDKSFDEVSWTKKGDEMYKLERQLANSTQSGHPALCKVSAQLTIDLQALRDDVIYNNKDPLPLLQAEQDKLQPELDKK